MALLRYRSGDRNSYDSEDWFDQVDFTYAADNWGVGLPPSGGNGGNWAVLKPCKRTDTAGALPPVRCVPGAVLAPALVSAAMRVLLGGRHQTQTAG